MMAPRQVLLDARVFVVVAAALIATFFTDASAETYTCTTSPAQQAAVLELAKRPMPVPRTPGIAGTVQPAPTKTLTPAQIIQGFVDQGLAGTVSQMQRVKDCAAITDAGAKARFGCAK